MSRPSKTHQFTKEFISPFLHGDKVAEAVAVLQKMYLSPPPDLDESIIDKVQLLTTHKDLGVRFWAKKVFKKYSFQFFKDEPERFGGGQESENLPLDILFKMLKDLRKSKFLAMKVLNNICLHKTPQALEFLLEYLKDTRDPYQISFLVKNLAVHFPSDTLVQALSPYLSHQDDRIVANTIEGLEIIASPKCFEIIAKFLKHRSNRVRANAAKAVANYNTNEAFEILTKMLNSRGQSHLVISACHAIKELKDPRFLPYLQQLLNDDLALDDVLMTMLAISQTRTNEILDIYVEKTEVRLQKIRAVQLSISSATISPSPLQEMQQTALGKWISQIDWLELFLSRRFLGSALVLTLFFGIFYFVETYETPEMEKARLELAKLRISFTTADFLQSMETNNGNLIDLFLKAGISVKVKNDRGATPLHFAAFSGEATLAGRLIKLGGNVNAVDNNGLTPLHLVTNVEVAEKLMEYGGNFLARDYKGRIPLHRAAESGRNEVVELFLRKGADINAQGKDGNTSLHLALRNKKEKTALLLITRGAKIDIKNQLGMSPRDLGLPKAADKKGGS